MREQGRCKRVFQSVLEPRFNDCTAWPSGGGMFLTRVDLTANGETHFNRCMAKSDVGATTSGGGLFFRKGRIVQAGGTMSLPGCTGFRARFQPKLHLTEAPGTRS